MDPNKYVKKKKKKKMKKGRMGDFAWVAIWMKVAERINC